MVKPEQPPTAESLKGLRILVVEDNYPTATDIKSFLQSAGTKAKITYDGEQALRLLAKEPNGRANEHRHPRIVSSKRSARQILLICSRRPHLN